MFRIVAVSQPNELSDFCTLPGLSSLSPEIVARHHPDASWLLLDVAGKPAGRCSLWWTDTPPQESHRLGLIGHYSATSTAAAKALLQSACDQLTAHGCTLAVGPMDGNTWQRYRLLTERGTEPVFFLEPDNPDDWPGHFTDNGFDVLANFYSSLATDLDRPDPRLPEMADRLTAEGVTIRPIDVGRFENALRSIHALSLASFRDNFLYTPIAEDDFVAQYRGIRDHVRPELVLVAEQQGQVVGYVFAIPDLFQARRGHPIDTIIVKTLAVHPDHGGKGLGNLLTARCRANARSLGFTRAIHALMHEDNRSRRIGGSAFQTMRRYALFARPLGGTP